MTTPPPAVSVWPWLRANLGPSACGMLTGTDARALEAAVQIVHLWSRGGSDSLLPTAFRACVLEMQPAAREFAYHAIAHIGEWSSRARVWALASLPPLQAVRRCMAEP